MTYEPNKPDGAINARSYALAFGFVREWASTLLPEADEAPATDRLTWLIETWVFMAGMGMSQTPGPHRLRYIRRRVRAVWSNDFAHLKLPPTDEVDIKESLTYLVMDFVGASEGEYALTEQHQDLVASAVRYARKYDRFEIDLPPC